jgi:ABC-2 type transport system ATP-binding protein
VVTTQVVSEAAYCDRVAVMRKGRILAVDTPENLRRIALGGEILHLTLESPADMAEAVETLERWDEVVSGVRRDPSSAVDLNVVVDDARERLPQVLNRLENKRPSIKVSAASPLEVSYDEVFITIMEQDAAQQEALQ